MTRLVDLAKIIRSKNAGVDKITFDVIFRSETEYRHVCNTGALTRKTVADLFNLSDDRITDFVTYDPAFAIKFSISRERPSGSAGDPDIFGAQQYAPLMSIEVPDP
ncbi:DUF4387 domain-containing protein [Roseibium sp. SCP14]|uniref:DUF4387 domain-containing protein n=1 Tax=Roseibium sp. SCP14 TaxID=3141375 RepID=UPI00333C6C71